MERRSGYQRWIGRYPEECAGNVAGSLAESTKIILPRCCQSGEGFRCGVAFPPRMPLSRAPWSIIRAVRTAR